MGKKDIDVFSPNSVESLRKELDGKIESKLSSNVFFSILGLFALIIIAVIGFIANNLNKIDEKASSLNDKVIRLETKFDDSISKGK